MRYGLTRASGDAPPISRDATWDSFRRFTVFFKGDEAAVRGAFIAIVVGALTSVATPYFIARATDSVVHKNVSGLLPTVGILGGIYIISLVSSYFQAYLTGTITQRTLFKLREAVFQHLQRMPIAFFNQNKAGDIQSRINNDTDKINNFLSQGLGRFIGNTFTVLGIGIFIFFLNPRLALVLISSTLVILLATRLLSPWSERLNKRGLASLGALSSEVQEDLSNFKVIVAFNRRNYFEQKIKEQNDANFRNTFRGSLSSEAFRPIYDFSGNFAQMVVLVFGIHLITQGRLTIGLLVGFIGYTQRFYDPLRMLAMVWGDTQTALAAWSRLSDLMTMESEIKVMEPADAKAVEIAPEVILKFDGVDFGYDPDKLVLEGVCITMCKGKTYALVGPTGGGKSTMASLMVRLYDPTSGTIVFDGKDIRCYRPEFLSQHIGFILQDPFLFTGTVGENIRYGNPTLAEATNDDIEDLLCRAGLDHLLNRFEKRLETNVSHGSENISLGQKQLISFIRTVLRRPKLLILDEATANVDTVTEQQLTEVIDHLGNDTTKVVIAHRLNTIRDADEIIFINSGHVQPALSFHEALELIDNSKRVS